MILDSLISGLHTYIYNRVAFILVDRGRMLQYMNGPKLQLAKLDLKEGRIAKQEFVMETAKALRMVKVATQCFDEYSF